MHRRNVGPPFLLISIGAAANTVSSSLPLANSRSLSPVSDRVNLCKQKSTTYVAKQTRRAASLINNNMKSACTVCVHFEKDDFHSNEPKSNRHRPSRTTIMLVSNSEELKLRMFERTGQSRIRKEGRAGLLSLYFIATIIQR